MFLKVKKIIIFGFLVFILVLGSTVYLGLWVVRKADKITLGLADPNFPFRDYSEEELAKMYPQIKNADVATRTTPEQTYAQFRQALADNNLEMAIKQLSKDSKNYKANKEALTKAYEEGKFMSISENYPQKIEKENMYEARAQFYFLESDREEVSRYPLDFIKNSDGDWKLDSL